MASLYLNVTLFSANLVLPKYRQYVQYLQNLQNLQASKQILVGIWTPCGNYNLSTEAKEERKKERSYPVKDSKGKWRGDYQNIWKEPNKKETYTCILVYGCGFN